MSDTRRRVALLARPGTARDSVRGALLEIGADIVVEDDPGTASLDDVRGASPEVLMIVLDAISENTLDRFDSMLGDPAVEVMFEEADVAASRDGWEAARWRRHLAAKLNHRDDVLPPVAGTAMAAPVDALSLEIEALIDTDSSDVVPESEVHAGGEAAAGDDFTAFDTTTAEAPADEFVLSLHGLELESSAIDSPLPDVGTIELESRTPEPLPPVTGPDFSASDFDPLLAELDAELPDFPLPESAQSATDWSGGLVEDFAPVDEVSFDDVAPAPAGPPPLPKVSFGELSLADDAAPMVPLAAAPRTHDLGDLERRISGLGLVDDGSPGMPAPTPPAVETPLAAEAAPTGVVLVLAGIGGPDAVRQLLGALPGRFPRPILLRQRLDGARYDKLVAQLTRASALPVELAVAGEPVRSGRVYVVGDDVGLSPDAATFVGGGEGQLLEHLPAAESAVVVLSGADAGLADRIDALRAQGAFVGAQSTDGCYDAAAASAVAVRGAMSALPSELAAELVGRWGR
ncbi:chemotaxis protein CheB [Lysobacter xanthus]